MTRATGLQRLIAEEPFVRALATSLCADEADDVVQQAYLQAMQSQAGALAHPRHWLARIVRNLASDVRRRQVRRDARHAIAQEIAPRNVCVPSSAELLEAEDGRRELVAAVDALPELQRAVVLLRYYEGLPPRRIAGRLGVPAGTVRNRLHEALQSLRRRLDARHGGDRRAWLLPLVPFTASPRALPWREVVGAPAAATTPLGAIVMITKTKVTAALAAAFVLAVLWIAWPLVPGAIEPPLRAPDTPIAVQRDLPGNPNEPAPDAIPAREAVTMAATAHAPTTGTLLVHVRYGQEPAAAGIDVNVSPLGGDFRVDARHAVTGADGTARFEAIPPGEHRALTGVDPERQVRAEVVAGLASECTLVLRKTFKLAGIVVDGAGVPVRGATVEACVGHAHDVDAAPIAVTAADGTFTARYAGLFVLVGARAPGFAASQLYSREVKAGKDQYVRIELLALGGSVEGVVVGPDGAPIAGAIVRAGEGRTASVPATPGAPPLPAQGRTDAEGRFRAVGVPAGTQPLVARAAGLAPWTSTCDIAAGLTASVRIVMTEGVTCAGVVRGEGGQPVAGAKVCVGEQGDFVLIPARSAKDGTFTLRGLPVGDVEVAASHDDFGKGSERVRGAAGETVRRDVTVSFRGALQGRLLDDTGAPISSAPVDCLAEGDGPRWRGFAYTRSDGRFAVPDCPAGRLLTVSISPPEGRALRLEHVDPRAGELALRAERDAAPSARIKGRVLRPDGSAAVGITVEAFRLVPRRGGGATVKDADGTFEISVAAGAWSLRIAETGYPWIDVPANDLQPGAEWNVGTLQLTRGGTLVVQDGGKKLSYLVADARGRFVCGVYAPVPPPRSALLAPGDYRLLVRGDGVAAHALPFTIRSGEETALEVKTNAGVRQPVEFVPLATATQPRGVEFEVRRNGELLLLQNADLPSLASELWLAPSIYTLATREREPGASVQFTVGDEEGQALRVELR